jgi:hypothetical protein
MNKFFESIERYAVVWPKIIGPCRKKKTAQALGQHMTRSHRLSFDGRICIACTAQKSTSNRHISNTTLLHSISCGVS